MKALAIKYPEIPIEVISGGLMIGDRVGPIGEVAPYVKNAYQDVEKATGVQFGEAFIKGGLEDGRLRMNSLPPAIALAVIREQFPEKSLAFAHALHDMIYVQGHSPEDQEALANTAENFGFDRGLFLNKLNVEKYEDLAKQDFMYAQQLQVTGYPALIVEKDDQLYLMAKGYTPKEVLFEQLEKLLSPT
jgi:putative protein-disulfide isomerase